MNSDKYVVYVDDDPDDRSLFMEAFHSIPDYRVVTLVNGFELMLFLKQRTREEMPSLIVLDINMPVMNGIDAARILRLRMPTVPIIMFTSYTSTFLEEEMRSAGVTEMVSKSDVFLLGTL